MELGGLFAADEPRLARSVGGSQLKIQSSSKHNLTIHILNTIIPFVEDIFSQLRAAGDTRILAEIYEGEISGVTGNELLELVRKASTFIASRGLKKGDRCGLLAANSIRWVAIDLALMAEGLIVVPLYSRQAPAELVAMMKDSTPSLVCCGTQSRRTGWMRLRSFYLTRFSPAWTEFNWGGHRLETTMR
jgi:long-subunit acyl-CoA synthetase (AMP-forming)